MALHWFSQQPAVTELANLAYPLALVVPVCFSADKLAAKVQAGAGQVVGVHVVASTDFWIVATDALLKFIRAYSAKCFSAALS